MEHVKKLKDGILLEVKAKPLSSQTRLFFKDNHLILELQSPPEDNKANKEAVKYLSSIFGCEVEIAYGFKGSRKGFLIKAPGEKADDVVRRLCT